MAKNQAPSPPPEPGVKPAGKGKLKLILLVLVALLLAIGLSVGATWFLLSKGDSAQDKEQAAPVAAVPVRQAAIYEPLVPAFVVNFNHQGRQRYMQVSMTLMGRDQGALDALKVHMPLLRNNLVMLLSGQDFALLGTPAGMEMLRQQITASVQELGQKELGKPVIEQVLFTNFVLQ